MLLNTRQKRVRGFIAVSAHRGTEGEGHTMYNHYLFSTLCATEPPRALTDTLIPPLCMMIEHLIDAEEEENESDG